MGATPIARGFRMVNPTKMDDLGVLLFEETTIIVVSSNKSTPKSSILYGLNHITSLITDKIHQGRHQKGTPYHGHEPHRGGFWV